MIKALLTKTKRSILSLLFTNPDESFYVREIIKKLDVGQGTVQRELALLTDAGIITREDKGNQVFYRANRVNPIFNEIHMLIIKTIGIADHLREALSPLTGKIEVAFIYGSIAKGTADNDSDVDLMVIGNVKFGDIIKCLRDAEVTIGREINPTVYPVREFKTKVKSENHFLQSVVDDEKIFVAGGENELEKIIRQ